MTDLTIVERLLLRAKRTGREADAQLAREAAGRIGALYAELNVASLKLGAYAADNIRLRRQILSTELTAEEEEDIRLAYRAMLSAVQAVGKGS